LSSWLRILAVVGRYVNVLTFAHRGEDLHFQAPQGSASTVNDLAGLTPKRECRMPSSVVPWQTGGRTKGALFEPRLATTMTDRQALIDKQLYRARISLNDFEQALDFLSAIEGCQRDVVRRALLTSAVISYSRPFLNNERSSEARATPKMRDGLRARFTPEQKLLHDEILRIRNQAIAHAEWSRYPVGRVVSAGKVILEALFFDVLTVDLGVGRFRDIAEMMKRHCVSDIFNLQRQLTATVER
jgi:hypothetical protein